MGLREEKKAATRTALSDIATTLFTERGFDAVTVAEVAAAARVSINTVFNYFPTKEDLFFDHQDTVINRLATAARTGGAAGVRDAFLTSLQQDEVTLGLSKEAAGFWAVVDGSPALQARLRHISEQAEEALAEALGGTAEARITAAIVAGIDRALHAEIRRRVQAKEAPEAIKKSITDLANKAYAQITTHHQPGGPLRDRQPPP
ncbi:TetR family transcriptional regulator [Umezawaea endophytica]|uniref:TetR/AcrR family transcriptional regulator n=1 Tax=Umezawaea endophytica TaxID=1654476 RepID=A0A9X2VXC5_9PSEU|nr:TetR/AcrR family transcriptional regulator [Umezawaea endophytica]MCS7483892.1 TetR/AcrR family transcriptional regulator [Umezawaea endophytica]